MEAVADTLAAIDASAPAAGVSHGASNGVYSAMAWAAWEYRVRVGRRTDLWRMKFRRHPSRRRHLWGSNDCIPVEPKPRFKQTYGGAVSYRLGNSMAGLMATQQKINNEFLRPLLDRLHQLANPPMIAGNHDLWWEPPQFGQPRFYERTGEIKWPSDKPQLPNNSTGLDRSQNAMLLRERGRAVTCKPAGRPCKMRRRSTK